MQMNTDIEREKHTMKFGYKYMYCGAMIVRGGPFYVHGFRG